MTPQYCGSCGSKTLELSHTDSGYGEIDWVCTTCGTEQGRFLEMIETRTEQSCGSARRQKCTQNK